MAEEWNNGHKSSGSDCGRLVERLHLNAARVEHGASQQGGRWMAENCNIGDGGSSLRLGRTSVEFGP
jgi:hypothetical protein